MVVLGGALYIGNRVYVHVVSDELMIHQLLEIAEEPPIRYLEEAQELVTTDLLGFQEPLLVPCCAAPPGG